GTVKKVVARAFSRPRSNGLIAIELQEGNESVNVALTDGSNDIMLVSDNGKAVRFHEENVRAMGRTARGVRGMRLFDEERVIALIVPQEGGQLLIASENGYGKRTDVEEVVVRSRGTKGVIAKVINERKGVHVGDSQGFGGEEM